MTRRRVTRWPARRLWAAPVVRGVLRATVAQAAAQASDEGEFFAQLRAVGVLVRERLSEDQPR